MTKPILVVTSRYTKEIEDRIDRDFNARRNPNQVPFSQQQIIATYSVPMGVLALDNVDAVLYGRSAPTLVQP